MGLNSLVPTDRTRSSGHALEPRRFHLNMEQSNLPVRVPGPWNGMLRDLVESPSLKRFKAHLDVAILGNLHCMDTALAEGLD